MFILLLKKIEWNYTVHDCAPISYQLYFVLKVFIFESKKHLFHYLITIENRFGLSTSFSNGKDSTLIWEEKPSIYIIQNHLSIKKEDVECPKYFWEKCLWENYIWHSSIQSHIQTINNVASISRTITTFFFALTFFNFILNFNLFFVMIVCTIFICTFKVYYSFNYWKSVS